jgi:hypothetical protein
MPPVLRPEQIIRVGEKLLMRESGQIRSPA